MGSSHGNADLGVVTVLCGDGDHVTGTVRFSERTGSTTLRALVGAWTADHARVVLHQTLVVSSVVSPEWLRTGWQWCETDTVYEFQPVDGTHLAGTYDSPACDRGTITLAAAGR